MDAQFWSMAYRATPNASPQDLEGPAPSTQCYEGDGEVMVEIELNDISEEGLDAVPYTDQLVIGGTCKHERPSGGVMADRGDGTRSGPFRAAILPSRSVGATHATATRADGVLTIVLPRGTDG